MSPVLTLLDLALIEIMAPFVAARQSYIWLDGGGGCHRARQRRRHILT
jgi:hypothetical protein